MKRSEFKSQLQQLLDHNLQYEHASDELVEQLTSFIEKSGLCPVTINDAYSTTSLQWEPEDET